MPRYRRGAGGPAVKIVTAPRVVENRLEQEIAVDFFSFVSAGQKISLIENASEENLENFVTRFSNWNKLKFWPVERMTEHFVARIPKNPEYAGIFAVSVFDVFHKTLTDDQFSNPTVDELRQSVDSAIEELELPCIFMALHWIIAYGMAAAESARKVLSDLEELYATELEGYKQTASGLEQLSELPQEVDQVDTEPLLEIENDVQEVALSRVSYSPLDQVLVRSALSVASGDQTAPGVEEFKKLIEEVISMSNARHMSWFHIGFARGLGIVELDFLETHPAINLERRTYVELGLLRALQRRDDTESLVGEIEKNWDLVKQVAADPLMESIFPDLVDAGMMRYPEKIRELLDFVPISQQREIEEELKVIERVDFRSSDFFRDRNAAGALGPLLSARRRLVRIRQERDDARNYVNKYFADLDVRLANGLVAGYRQNGEIDNAIKIIQGVDERTLEAANERTYARFLVQRILTEGKVHEIQDIGWPRTPEEKSDYLLRWGNTRDALLKAAKLNQSSTDVQYLLAGLYIASNDFSSARLQFGPIRQGYVNRENRHRMIAEIDTFAMLAEFNSTLPRDLANAVVGLKKLIPNVALNADETQVALRNTWQYGGSALTDFVNVFAEHSASFSVHNPDLILEIAKDRPDLMPQIIRIIAKIRDQRIRYRALRDLLAIAQDFNLELDEIVDAIDSLVAADQSVKRIWMTDCESDLVLREFLTEEIANQQALGVAHDLNDLGKVESLLCSRIESFLSVHNVREFAIVRTLIEDLREINANLAKIYSDDLRVDESVEYLSFDWRRPEPQPAERAPVRIALVGSTEEAMRTIDQFVLSEVSKIFGARVNIDFYHPGWSSNWSPKLDSIKAALPDLDVLVLMPLVRTTFGKRLRAAVGDAGRVWLPCTGKGQGSVRNAVFSAIEFADSRNMRDQL